MKSHSTDKELGVCRRALPQFLAVGCKNLVLMGYGCTIGFPTILIPAVQGGNGGEPSEGEFRLTKDEISWLSSINLLCLPLGCFLSGMLCEPFGKRRAMQLVSIPMFMAWMLFHFASQVNHLYAGLALAGLGGGLMEAPVLTYVAEVTQPQFRGMLASTGTMCVITGIFTQFILGTFFTWREVALISCCMPIITIIALFFVPESPYWLLTKGLTEQAKESLCWLRGWVPFAKVADEYNEIYEVLETKRLEAEALKRLPIYKRIEPFTRRGFIAPFLLVSAAFLAGHFSGQTTLQTYAVDIFHTLKSPIDKYYATILLGAAELIGASLSILLVHWTGKRPLLFASLVGVAFCFCATATYAYFIDSIPGVAVENIVANYSVEHLDRSSYINEQNITEALRLTSVLETSTEFINSGNGSESVTQATPVFANSSTTEDTNKIFLAIPNAEKNPYSWLPMTLLIASGIFSHVGIRITPWMLIGEVFPVNVRSSASGISSGVGYMFAFFSNKLFLSMVSTFALSGTFWLYSVVAIVSCILFYFVLPETEGRTLIDIEEHFLGKKSLSQKSLNISRNNGLNEIGGRGGGVGGGGNGCYTNEIAFTLTVQPQTVAKPQTNGNGNGLNGNSLMTTDNRSEHRLSVPEVLLTPNRQPGAGSKRYKHRVTDTLRSRSSIESSNEDVQDTHL